MSYADELFSLKGKTALVTGGTSGIGQMIATALVKVGADVMIASRNGTECERVAAELNELDDGSAEGFAGDVSSETGIAALVEAVKARTDRLNILVNNAGTAWAEPLETFPYKAWTKVLGVNVIAVFDLARELLPLLEAAASDDDPARIINLGSVMGIQPVSDGNYAYMASKAAVHHLTRNLALELSGRRITVNAFAPGTFQSRMMNAFVGTADKASRTGHLVPLGRIGVLDDIAGATIFLTSRAGRYITGVILPIDGGLSVHHGIHFLGGEHV